MKKIADSRKRAEILADNRKSHHPIETLIQSVFLNTNRDRGLPYYGQLTGVKKGYPLTSVT